MARHLTRWLNDAALRELGDRFEGEIASVTEEQIRNRFTGQKQLEPVITFTDGWRLVPNIGQRRALVAIFESTDTDDWIGRRLVVYRVRVEKKDAKAGTARVVYEKRCCLPIPRALREAPPARKVATAS